MKITDKIHLLRIDFEVPIAPRQKLLRFVNVLIIFGDKITIVDTGVKGSESTIFDYITGQGRSFFEIKSIILSHAHPDHIGCAARIKELTDCKIVAHELEREWIENIERQNEERPVPGFFTLVDRSVIIDDFLTDGQILKVDEGISLGIIHSPGHSKGSLNIQFIEDKILFTADSIPLKGDIPNYDNFDELMQSIGNIKANTCCNTLLTSWTPPLFNKEEASVLITDGEVYMQQIDAAVCENYTGFESEPFYFCRKTVTRLGLPPFWVNPIVDKAFRSHKRMF
jgi:glyoxylase-like metal-dependent hydrolase (beta-lactamase superfamily II)